MYVTWKILQHWKPRKLEEDKTVRAENRVTVSGVGRRGYKPVTRYKRIDEVRHSTGIQRQWSPDAYETQRTIVYQKLQPRNFLVNEQFFPLRQKKLFGESLFKTIKNYSKYSPMLNWRTTGGTIELLK